MIYYFDDERESYGDLEWPFEEWVFDDENILMGLHGKTSGGKIKQLGFISV